MLKNVSFNPSHRSSADLLFNAKSLISNYIDKKNDNNGPIEVIILPQNGGENLLSGISLHQTAEMLSTNFNKEVSVVFISDCSPLTEKLSVKTMKAEYDRGKLIPLHVSSTMSSIASSYDMIKQVTRLSQN